MNPCFGDLRVILQLPAYFLKLVNTNLYVHNLKTIYNHYSPN